MKLPTTSRSTAAFCLMLTATFALAQRKTHPGSPFSADNAPPDLTLESADLSQNPGLKAASKIAPVAPEKLQQLLPERLDKWKRIKLDGKVSFVGPAAHAEVNAQYELRRGTNLDLQLLDPAGRGTGGMDDGRVAGTA